ncbi:MAG: DnaA/Hda family protein [Candidatus Brocadiia bacterium]
MDRETSLELRKILDRVAAEVDKHPEASFLDGELLAGDTGGSFVLRVRNNFAKKLVMHRYFQVLKKTLSESMGRLVEVSVVVGDNGDPAETSGSNVKATIKTEKAELPADVPKPTEKAQGFVRGNIRSDFRLDNFVQGDCNRLAYNAVLDIALQGRSAFYPLYIYSGTGLGKTHLLQGLCSALAKHHPELRVVYTTCEEYTNAYIQGIRNNRIEDFRRDHREIDVLVIDDVHFLSNKKGSQEEFVHILNTLQNRSKSLVVASDASPDEQQEILEHLLQRFRGGLVVEMKMPDYATRLKILEGKLTERRTIGLHLEKWHKFLEYVAARKYGNIREYEGALNRILFSVSVHSDFEKVTLDDVRKILKEANRIWTLEECFSRTCTTFCVTREQMVSPCRSRKISKARKYFALLARDKIGLSLSQIGKQLGGRAHTSILDMVRELRSSVAADPDERKIWEEISEL